MTFVIKQDDNRPYLRELLFQGGDDPAVTYYFDPTSYTVTFSLIKGTSTTIVNKGAAFIVSATIGTARAAVLQAAGRRLANGGDFVAGTYVAVEYRWGDAGATATASSSTDDMSYEWETTLAGAIETFPNGGNNTMTIKAQLK